MKLLLDTHVVLWQLTDPVRVGERARRAVDAAESAYLSVISFAEVGIKVATGKLALPRGLREFVPDDYILLLTPEHGLALADLPLLHRDPFDRLLIAQALAEDLTIVTSDASIQRYDVPWIEASE